jgi:hypothetical protein
MSEEEAQDNMEEGKDINELNTDLSIKTKIITHNGKKWKVTYHEIGWYAKKQLIKPSTSIDRANKAQFDLALYTRLCLKKMGVAINGHILSDVDYLKLDEKVGEQLDELVGSPQKIISEEEADFTEP